MLKPGRYQTRNSRVVLLTEPFSRDRARTDGAVVPITGLKGTLMKADGKTPDSEHEWENTLLPRVLGVFSNPHAMEGMASEYDLVQRIGD